MKKKIFFKRPLFGIIILFLGIMVLLAKHFLPAHCNGGIGEVYFSAPVAGAISADGRYAVIDEYDTVYIINPDGTAQNIIFMEEDDSASEVVFDEEGNLYVLVKCYDEEGMCYEEYVEQYNPSGKYVRDAFYNTDTDNTFFGGIQIVGDSLYYLESTEEEDYVVEYNIKTKNVNKTVAMTKDDGAYVEEYSVDYKGNYAITYNDKTAGILYEDGTYQEFLDSDYDFYTNPDAYTAINVAIFDGGLMTVLSEENMDVLYYIENPYDEPEAIISTLDVYPLEYIDEQKYFMLYVSTLWSTRDGVVFSAYDEMFFMHNDGSIDEVMGCKSIPFWITFCNIINKIGLTLGWILTAIGALLCLGNIMKWRLTLLWKQLFITVPIVVVMFVVLTVNFVKQYDKLFVDNTAEKLLQLNEVAVDVFDGDELQAMSDFSIVKDGRLEDLEYKLFDVLYEGSEDWAEDIECSIYLLKDGLYGLFLGSSDVYSSPFTSSMNLGESMDELIEIANEGNDPGILVARDDSAVLYTGGYDTDHLSVSTLIYNSDYEPVAMLITNINYSSFEDARHSMIIKLVGRAVIFLLILVAALVLTTYLNTRRLKMAGNAITEIAAGNFSARVKKVGNDEVGAICGGVNEMAEKLELHFEALDRNEKFYYKFVPEKFKELLHKESFTDLQLGDAESADLTVLFCDIRSFSLNSEMMTAKENFEFVNVIYGKAGPIIRKHNGFVDKYIGDAVMALFESADDALAAGQELYKEIVLKKETAEELGVQSINIGVGIHSGMARIGIVGEDERLSGTVISNTVNISSRLESLTKQYNTAMIITKETLDRLSDPDSLKTRYLGMIQVAGVNEVKALYEVLDCLDDDRKIPREKNAHDFREAIKAFHMGKADEACKMLESLVSDEKNDPVPSMYFEYVKEKINTGDSEHNVFKFEKK